MNLAQHMLMLGVRLYQGLLSPAKSLLFGPMAQCRFTPSCSHFAAEAIARHGAIHGSRLAVGRICRCHPWGGCGWDPVPEPRRIASTELAPAHHTFPESS